MGKEEILMRKIKFYNWPIVSQVLSYWNIQRAAKLEFRRFIDSHSYIWKQVSFENHYNQIPCYLQSTLDHSYPNSLTCPHITGFQAPPSHAHSLSLANAHLKIWQSRHYPIINATQGYINFLTSTATQLVHAKHAVQLKISDILSKKLFSWGFSFSTRYKFNKCSDF